jgi:hypothetical protein
VAFNKPRLPISCPSAEHRRDLEHERVRKGSRCTGDLSPAQLYQRQRDAQIPVDCSLAEIAHGFVLIRLDGNAEVDIDSREDVLDSDNGIPRGESSMWPDKDQPGKTIDTKLEGGRRRVRGGLGKNGRRKLWVDHGVAIMQVISQVWRLKLRMKKQVARTR